MEEQITFKKKKNGMLRVTTVTNTEEVAITLEEYDRQIAEHETAIANMQSTLDNLKKERKQAAKFIKDNGIVEKADEIISDSVV